MARTVQEVFTVGLMEKIFAHMIEVSPDAVVYDKTLHWPDKQLFVWGKELPGSGNEVVSLRRVSVPAKEHEYLFLCETEDIFYSIRRQEFWEFLDTGSKHTVTINIPLMKKYGILVFPGPGHVNVSVELQFFI